ncbi:MAG: hypothetical protein JXR70_14230 [Spirochaetales bacterium]|nr:hypothetical protein [Spirochaetales bacterium]
MREIIDKVLDTEQKAEALLKEAREKAALLRNEEERKGADKIKDAKDKAQQILQDKTTMAREKASEDFSRAMVEAEIKQKTLFEENQEAAKNIISDVLKIITVPEFRKD